MKYKLKAQKESKVNCVKIKPQANKWAESKLIKNVQWNIKLPEVESFKFKRHESKLLESKMRKGKGFSLKHNMLHV